VDGAFASVQSGDFVDISVGADDLMAEVGEDSDDVLLS